MTPQVFKKLIGDSDLVEAKLESLVAVKLPNCRFFMGYIHHWRSRRTLEFQPYVVETSKVHTKRCASSSYGIRL